MLTIPRGWMWYDGQHMVCMNQEDSWPPMGAYGVILNPAVLDGDLGR